MNWRQRLGAFIGGFDAGQQHRRLRGFQATRAHVNALIAASGPDITARARWLVRNNGYPGRDRGKLGGRKPRMTPRETILTALADLLRTIPHVPVLRGEVLPERIPPAGLMILRDGNPGEPGVTLSPLAYHYQHRAELEMIVQSSTARDALFDTLAAQVGAVISADRTLRGSCDWVEATAPEPVDLAVEGAASLKAAIVPIILNYSLADPLG